MSTPRIPLQVVHDDVFLEHDAPGHPENAMRLEAINRQIAADAELGALPLVASTDIDMELVLDVHRSRHVLGIERLAAVGGGWIDGDTYCTNRSFDVARRAAGAVVDAVVDRAMGFCLYNGVAVAIEHARSVLGVRRVAVVDIDVHHGNGTQEVFDEDPGVLFCSLHQWPLYPGTGRSGEIGHGAGAGATVNVPLAEGTDGAAWLAAFDEHVTPALRAHRPELILVSAGFDAHAADPLAGLELSTETYAEIAQRIDALAAELCDERSVWTLEGGYDLEALPASVARTLTTLNHS